MEILNTIPNKYVGNDAYMNIIKRVSVRRYSDNPVSSEQVSAILHAAMSAPTGVNRQPWEFIVVDDSELLKQLADALPYAKMAELAPVAIIVCGNKDRFLDGVDDVLWEQDLSAASENILLVAHAIGLGGVWTCIYPHGERIAPVKSISLDGRDQTACIDALPKRESRYTPDFSVLPLCRTAVLRCQGLDFRTGRFL